MDNPSGLLLFVHSSGANSCRLPTFKITPEDSSTKFAVKASVPLEGTFEKWNATFTVTSTDAESGVLDVKIEANGVNTGSGMKDGKLKGKVSGPPLAFKQW